MKKLMIAAAAAALVSGAFAALPEAGDTINLETRVGVMHNVSMTIKTLMPTVIDTTKTKGCAICPTTTGDKCYIFEQGTLKLNGIFAACDCDTSEVEEMAPDGEIAGNLFTYGYFWLGSGKKVTVLYDEKLTADVTDYNDLPSASEAGVAVNVFRYSKTNKKAVVQVIVNDGSDVDAAGYGFGSYTDAKYKFDETLGDDGQYVLKSLAKVSASGSICGTITVDLLKAYLVDQGKLSREDSAENFMCFPVTSGCTIEIDCTDGDRLVYAPISGTFSIKGTTTKALKKVIPAACWE